MPAKVTSESVQKPKRIYKLKLAAEIINRNTAVYFKALRNNAGLTMRELAPKLGIPHSMISKFEKHQRTLKFGEFHQYCLALGKDPDAVFAAINALPDDYCDMIAAQKAEAKAKAKAAQTKKKVAK